LSRRPGPRPFAPFEWPGIDEFWHVKLIFVPSRTYFRVLRDLAAAPELMSGPKRPKTRHRQWNARQRAFVAPVPAIGKKINKKTPE